MGNLGDGASELDAGRAATDDDKAQIFLPLTDAVATLRKLKGERECARGCAWRR